MKTINNKNRFFNFGALILTATVIFLSSCSKDFENVKPNNLPDNEKSISIGTSNSGVSSVALMAGQNIVSGQVSFDDIDTDGDHVNDALQVTYSTQDGWEITAIQFWVGSSMTTLPVNKSGNPQIGQFPYKYENLGGVTSYTFTIPFSTIGFTCSYTGNYYVAAHANVRKMTSSGSYQTETGWGDGLRLLQKGNWAMYFVLFIKCDEQPPITEYSTQTAFAYGNQYSNCFQEYPEFLDNPQRWGWTNGPLAEGDYTFPIYAGAGLCDLSKGTNVGNLQISYHSGTATFTYQISGVNPQTGMSYSLDEVHLYAGSELFARNKQGEFTLAPGQYPKKATGLNSASSYSFTVNNLSGSIYVVAHAVVNGFPL